MVDAMCVMLTGLFKVPIIAWCRMYAFCQADAGMAVCRLIEQLLKPASCCDFYRSVSARVCQWKRRDAEGEQDNGRWACTAMEGQPIGLHKTHCLSGVHWCLPPIGAVCHLGHEPFVHPVPSTNSHLETGGQQGSSLTDCTHLYDSWCVHAMMAQHQPQRCDQGPAAVRWSALQKRPAAYGISSAC